MATLNPNFVPETSSQKDIFVPLGERAYTVHVGEQLLRSNSISDACMGRQVLVVCNDVIAPLHFISIL